MNVKQPDRPFRSERLNYIVGRMRVSRGLTPADLARELNVSERTIYRDLRSLEKSQSVKKHYSRREGRYLLETEATLPPLSLTTSEGLALYNAASVPALAARSFFASDLQSALKKLNGALVPPSIDSDDGPASLAETILRPTLAMIERAIRSNRKLLLRYAPVGDGERRLVVAPYDLRSHNGHWFMLANAEDLGGVRAIRVARVRAVEILADRFRFPRRFSADDCFARVWETYGEGDDEITVKVRFVPAIASVVSDNCGHQFSSIESQPDGSVVGTASVGSGKDLYWWILAYGSMAEVLSPPELRDELCRIALSIAALYVANR